jgi:Family of unknown function (DUF6084)
VASPASTGAPPIASPPQLEFRVEHAHPVRYSAVPTLGFEVRLARAGGGTVRSVALNVQLRIAATRRSYAEAEQSKLLEVFGLPEQWSSTVRSLLWTHAPAQVPAFTDATTFELAVPCTYDFEVTAAKYLNALEDGEIPLELLFSGTVFYADPQGRLQVASISWDREAEYRLPVSVWREMMDRHFGGTTWLRLRRDTFDRLSAYKARNASASWEDAVEGLLREAGQGGG